MRIKEELVLGDSIEYMQTLKDKSVDLIIADYPFNIQDSRKDYYAFVKETVDEFERISKDISNLVVINNPHNIFKTAHYYHNWTLINEIALIRKGALRPAWHFGFQHNSCLVLNKGGVKNKWNGTKVNHDKDFFTDVMEYQNSFRSKHGFHPQAIPFELTKLFVTLLSNYNDTVLDTFVGSGTTHLVCRITGRVCVGAEINEKYYNLAVNRLKDELAKRNTQYNLKLQ